MGAGLKAADPECNQVEQKIHQRTEDLALIGLLNRAINRGDTLQEILKLLTKETRRIFSSGGATTYLLSEDKTHLVLHKSEILPARLKGRVEKLIGMKIPTEIRVPLKAENQYLQMLKSRKPQLINDPETIIKLMSEFAENKIPKRLIPEIYKILGIRSVMYAPLIAEDEAIGLLNLSRDEPFSESDLQRLEVISEELISIVERKRTKERLEKECNLLRTVIDNLPDTIYVKDREGRYVVCNIAQAHSVREETTPEDVVGKTDLELYPKELAAEYRANDEMVIQSGQPLLNKEECGTNLGGDEVWLLSTKVPFRDTTGEIIGLVGISRDITDRQRAEKNLRAAEREKELILSSVSELVTYQDNELRIMWANRAAGKSVGLSADELAGRHCYEIWHQRSEPCIDCPVLEALKTGESQNAEMMTPDGRVWFIEGHPVRGGNGDVTGAVEVTLEITERKRAEEALRESEERYRALFEQAADSIVLVDAETGALEEYNSRAYESLGYTQEEFEKLKIQDLEVIESDKEVVKHIEKIIKEESEVFETKHRTKGGQIRDILVSGRAISIGGKNLVQGIWRDVTDLKRAEREIRGISQFQESIIANVNVWLNVLDERANIILWNRAAEEISGYSREEIVGHDKIWQWLYPDEAYRRKVTERVASTLADGAADDVLETTIRCKEGENRIIAWNQKNLINEKGDFIGSVVLGRDITQQKNAEERVQYQADLLQHVSDAIISTDLEFNIKSWNKAAEKIYGWKAGEVMGKPVHKVTQLEYPHDRMEDVLEKFFEKGFWEGEVLQKRKDGAVINVLASESLVRDRDGNPAGAVTINRDITERKRAEEELRKSEARYSELVERSKDGVAVIQDGVVNFVNSAATDLFGYSLEEVMEKSFLEFIPANSRKSVQKRYTDRMAGKPAPSIYEIELLKKDGSTVPVEVNAGRVEIEGKSADLVFIRDITERKQAAKKLQKALESTIQAVGLTTEMRDPYTAGHQKRVTRLACAIAHEMGLSEERIENIRIAGLMHDIGKMSIPSEILSKPSRLADMEYRLVQGHPQVAYDILKKAELPCPIADIVLQHHERMDGSGYPHGIKGEEIMLESRILAVADVVEAMASHRPYRPALGMDAALKEITLHKGNLYDSDVVDTCIRLFAEKHFQFED